MTDDLITWLRAQLDEDEVAAFDASAEWQAEASHLWAETTEEAAAHIRRHDPARVLAEVEAKRRIVDEHKHVGLDASAGPTRTCWRCNSFDWCPTLRLLALPYADRSGYREEWAA